MPSLTQTLLGFTLKLPILYAIMIFIKLLHVKNPHNSLRRSLLHNIGREDEHVVTEDEKKEETESHTMYSRSAR